MSTRSGTNPPSKSAAFVRGRNDCKRRKSLQAIPYRDIEKAKQWEEGWKFEASLTTPARR